MTEPYTSTATLGNVASNVSNVKYTNAGEQALVEQEGKTGVILAKGAMNLYEQVEAADVMKANNEYNLRMGELRNRLLQNKEGNALENAKLYAEGRQKIIDDLMKKGPDTIKYGRGQRAFMTTIDKDWVNQSNAMDRYVIGEAEKYQNTQLYNQLYSGINEVASNFMDDEAVQSAVNRGDQFIAARYFNYGQERIQAEQTKWKAKVYETQVTAALNQNDYAKAEDILTNHGEVFTPESRLKVKKAIDERKKSDDQIILFNDLYAKGDLMAAINAVKASDLYRTETEKAQAEFAVMNFFNAKDKQKRTAADLRYKAQKDQAEAWFNQGIEIDEALRLAEKASGTDTNALHELRLAVTDAYSSGGKGLPIGMDTILSEDIGNGEFDNKSELAKVLRMYGATKAEFNAVMKSYDKWTKGEGEYAFNWKDIKEQVMKDSGFKPTDKANYQQAWNEAQAAGKAFILEYTKGNNAPPDYRKVIDAARAGMIKNYTGNIYGGDNFKYSEGAMKLAGIENIVPVGSDIYAVSFMDGRPVHSLTGYDLERLLNRGE